MAGCGKPLLFVHGFGASIGHWRKNIAVLSKDYKVYAIDLIGQGRSDKPLIAYTMELWAEQVAGRTLICTTCQFDTLQACPNIR